MNVVLVQVAVSRTVQTLMVLTFAPAVLAMLTLEMDSAALVSKVNYIPNPDEVIIEFIDVK